MTESRPTDSEQPRRVRAVPLSGELRIGPYRAIDHELLYNNRPVEIPPRALSLLREFLRDPGRIRSRADLETAVWGNVNVDPTNLDHQIGNLRRALNLVAGMDGNHPPEVQLTIKNEPGQGYRLVVGHFERQTSQPEPAAASVASATVDPVPATAFREPVAPSPAPQQPRAWVFRFFKPVHLLGLVPILIAAAAGYLVAVRDLQPPEVVQISRVTRDGQPKFGPLLTDGGRIYFRATHPGGDFLAVALRDGTVQRLQPPLTGTPNLFDLEPASG